MTVTADREIEYGGLLLTGPYHVQAVEGLLGLPEVRTSDRPLLVRHGLHPGTDYLGARTVTVTVDVVAFDEDTFADAVGDIQAAFAALGPESPLVFRLPGVAGGNVAQVYARARRMALTVGHGYFEHSATCVADLVATDPLIYGATESSGATGLPSAAGGRTYPRTYPLDYGGVVSTGGRIIAVNNGTFPAPWVARIDGPVNDPRLTHVGTDETVKLDLAVDAGDYVIIDSAARSVLLNGTASRYSALTTDSTWFALAPGSNEIAFAASTSTAATATLSWRSAWL